MANEYQIFNITAETTVNPLGAVRLYSLHSEIAHDGETNAPLRIYNFIAEAIYDLRVGFATEFLSDPDEVFSGFVWTTPFLWDFIPSTAEVHEGFSFVPAKFTIPDRERNPYQAHITADPRFPEEQQRTLRDQHNRTQAGDTTFDYGLLLKGTPNQLYTPGSVGRFYHDRFGLIIARYVQFQDCVETLTQGAPVGYFATSPSVDWVVTNDYTKSGPDFVLGVMCLKDVPADGTYGWVVTEGTVPVPMHQTLGITPAPETPYGWSGTGTVDIEVSGKVVGRRWGRALGPVLTGGTLFVRLEGTSPQSFIEWVVEELQPINSAITALDSRLDAAEPTITELQGTTQTHSTQIATLSQRITTEAETRSRDIQEIRSQISAQDWSAAIAFGDDTVREEFRLADDALTTRIGAVEYTAQQAYLLASGVEVSGIGLRLDGHDTQILNLYQRLDTLAIDNLTDVDTVTTPPVDGDVLTWIAANSMWEPLAPPSGGGGGAFSGALVNRTASLTAQNFTTLTAIPFNQEIYDYGGWHDNSSNPSRLTVPSGVDKIRLVANVRSENKTAGDWIQIVITKNGTNVVGLPAVFVENAAGTTLLNVASGVVEVTAGDYFECRIQVESDTSSDVGAGQTWFSVEQVG